VLVNVIPVSKLDSNIGLRGGEESFEFKLNFGF
jgi:hypothetical protein